MESSSRFFFLAHLTFDNLKLPIEIIWSLWRLRWPWPPKLAANESRRQQLPRNTQRWHAMRVRREVFCLTSWCTFNCIVHMAKMHVFYYPRFRWFVVALKWLDHLIPLHSAARGQSCAECRQQWHKSERDRRLWEEVQLLMQLTVFWDVWGNRLSCIWHIFLAKLFSYLDIS